MGYSEIWDFFLRCSGFDVLITNIDDVLERPRTWYIDFYRDSERLCAKTYMLRRYKLYYQILHIRPLDVALKLTYSVYLMPSRRMSEM